MSTLVIGGTGFLGSAITAGLIKQGINLRILVRPTSQLELDYPNSAVQVVYGDVFDLSSLEKSMEGCKEVFCITPVAWNPYPKAYIETTLLGTKNIMEAAFRQKLKVIYTSSFRTIGNKKGTIGSESSPHRGYFLSKSERIKFEAEQLAFSYLEKGLPVVFTNPAITYGMGKDPNWGSTLIEVLNQRLRFMFNGVVSWVYIEDVVKAHILIAEKGRIGNRYILSERILSYSDFCEFACILADVLPPRRLPNFIAGILGIPAEFVSLITKKPPVLSWGNYREYVHGLPVDGTKITKELGFAYTPMEIGLSKTISLYWEKGLLKKRPGCVLGPHGIERV